MSKKVQPSGKVRRSYYKKSFQIFIAIYLILLTLFALFSLFITLVNAAKTNDEIIYDIFSMPDIIKMWGVLIDNFSLAWSKVQQSFFNSIIVSLIGALGDVFLGAVLAYLFCFRDFPFKEIIFTIFISVMLLPSIMGMPILVPFMKDKLMLGDTYIGYLMPNWAGGQVTALFLFRTFFGQQPKSLYESAKVEGANDAAIFLKITLPLALPIILYHFVNCFSSLYNDFLWASLILDKNITLMPIMHALQGGFESQQGAMYAMYTISSAPLIVTTIISMKYFASGDFASGMKL